MEKQPANGILEDFRLELVDCWQRLPNKFFFFILLVAWLGWLFDGMEMGLYSVLAAPALKDLLHSQDPKVVGYFVGVMFALFLLGASVGGFVFGRLGCNHQVFDHFQIPAGVGFYFFGCYSWVYRLQDHLFALRVKSQDA